MGEVGPWEVDALYVILGLLLLVGGGEGLVRGASGLALAARISPAVVGLTIVAAGTSMPELVVSVQSAVRGSAGLAIGNVVGSNVFNIGAILGLAALVRPLRVLGNTVRMEWPVMMLAALQLFLLARDGVLDRVEGGFLFTALVAFAAYAVWLSRHASTPVETEEFEQMATASFGTKGGRALSLNLLATAGGVALLAGGSTLLVQGSVAIAEGLGVSEAVIGLTIVAAGTSTPELVTSLVASKRGRDDIAIANVVGSNIFNILGILGVTALVHPLDVPDAILTRDIWWMLGASLLLFPLMRTRMRVTRLEGAALVAGFTVYLVVLLAAARSAPPGAAISAAPRVRGDSEQAEIVHHLSAGFEVLPRGRLGCAPARSTWERVSSTTPAQRRSQRPADALSLKPSRCESWAKLPVPCSTRDRSSNPVSS